MSEFYVSVMASPVLPDLILIPDFINLDIIINTCISTSEPPAAPRRGQAALPPGRRGQAAGLDIISTSEPALSSFFPNVNILYVYITII